MGIETSCDETAVSIIEARNDSLKIISNVVSSQVALHAKWGGVVPNLAAREHVKNILPVCRQALRESSLDAQKIDLLAVAHGPGLIPALLIGTNFAKSLAYVWKKPLIGVHHIEGHIYANFISDTSTSITQNQLPEFPILCLVVSGGHTQLVIMESHLHYEIIGETLDDAAGEAFDKVARILGLGYPGGPAIATIAREDERYKLRLPRPLMNSSNLSFSFSGLKTAALYETKKHPALLKKRDYVAAVAAEFQRSVVDVLVSKTLRAARLYRPRTIMLAGGVSANNLLRKCLKDAILSFSPTTKYHFPDPIYSLDNAAMIAAAAYYKWSALDAQQQSATQTGWKTINASANLELSR